jgi:AcrR family transcriptional regulator
MFRPPSSQARTSDDVTFELPLIQPEGPKERADAARNRRRILEAAGALVADQGIEAVSMDDVARAACVGTGTLYRRFGDRAGLAFALLDEQTRDFQNTLISGPPPLGPGAPASERLKAFGQGYLDLMETHSSLMVAAAPGGKEADGPYSLYVTHLAILLREAAPGLDAQFTAEALLATLSPAHHVRLRGRLGWPLERMRAGWNGLVEAIAN